MKTLNYKIITILLIFITGVAGAQEDYRKKYHEQYDVEKGDLFEISNRFGDIKIENTNANSITIDAEVVVKSKSEDKAKRIMEKISINISKNGNVIKAETDMEDISTSKSSFEINYTVLMPASLNINLQNKYGNVTINELHGKSNLAVKYGSLNVNKMLDGKEKPLSTIELGYCERSKINELNWAKVAIKYSKLELETGKAIAVSSKYSKLRIGNFSSLVAESGYDDYKIGSINNLKMDAKYSNIEVGELTKKLKVENKYGNIDVAKIPNGFESINIVSKYAKIDLGIATDANYKLDAKSSYADIKYNNLNIQQRIRESQSMEIRGYSGAENTNATVTIVTEYGDADLRE